MMSLVKGKDNGIIPERDGQAASGRLLIGSAFND